MAGFEKFIANQKDRVVRRRDESVRIVELLKAEGGPVFRKYGIGAVRVFGSVARGEAGRGSDVDLLVDPPVKGMDYYSLCNDLEELLGRDVDLHDTGEEKSLVERFMRDSIPVFGDGGAVDGVH